MGGGDGADPVNDIVLVEVDGRLVAGTGVERMRARRHARPTTSGARSTRRIDAAASAPRSWAGRWTTLVSGRRARIRDGASSVRGFSRGHGDRPSRAPRRGRVRDGPPLLPDAPGRARRRPGRSVARGLEIRPVTEDQWRTIFDAENEAFRDHWGHREMTDDDFRTTFGQAELDTDLWVVAWDGDQVAGVVQNWVWPEENERLGVERGWLEHISVRRPWRRRGLARAITAASLVKLRERGLARRCSASTRRTRTGRSACTRDSVSASTAARRPTSARSTADARPAVA